MNRINKTQAMIISNTDPSTEEDGFAFGIRNCEHLNINVMNPDKDAEAEIFVYDGNEWFLAATTSDLIQSGKNITFTIPSFQAWTRVYLKSSVALTKGTYYLAFTERTI